MPESDAAPVLTASELVAGYLPGIHILNSVLVDVFAGEVRCVLGPNGTGKSTLLKVLFGFLPALSGEMRLGAPCWAMSPHTAWAPSARQHVSVSLEG